MCLLLAYAHNVCLDRDQTTFLRVQTHFTTPVSLRRKPEVWHSFLEPLFYFSHLREEEEEDIRHVKGKKKFTEQPVTFKRGSVTGMGNEGKGSDLNSRSLGSNGIGKKFGNGFVVCFSIFHEQKKQWR